MYFNRDMGIDHIQGRRDRICSGMGLGIMLFDDYYPGFPGDVRNPSAYPFPIQYIVAEGVDANTLVLDKNPDQCLSAVLTAARRLEQMGCRAVAAECGYFAYFQKEVAAEVSVPVFMSSLLQVNWVRQLIGPEKPIGILCAVEEYLTEPYLKGVGIDPAENIVIGGAMDQYGVEEFYKLWIPSQRPEPPQASYAVSEAQFVKACTRFYEDNPELGAMVFECTGFQPFARAAQRAVGLPIFTWGTLLDYAYSVVVHRDFYGHV